MSSLYLDVLLQDAIINLIGSLSVILSCTKVRKSPGPDGMGVILKSCAWQLGGIFFFHFPFLLGTTQKFPVCGSSLLWYL